MTPLAAPASPLILLDAMMIDQLHPMPGCDVLMPYGSSFGSPQGPARATPLAWVKAQTKPKWMIYFPGADPAKALAEAQSVGAKGVAMDLESRFEHDPWSRAECATFGNYFAGKMPRVLYCHQGTIGTLAASYDGGWWPGMTQSTPRGPHDAVQWNYAGGYDLSIASPWYANPNPQPEVPMAGGFYHPGVPGEYHWVTIDPDKSIRHCYVNTRTAGATPVTENLGGIAGGPAGICWSNDGSECTIDVIGSDGKGVDLNTFKGGKWGGWSSTGTSTLQLGVQGPKGDPGPAGIVGPFKATITPG